METKVQKIMKEKLYDFWSTTDDDNTKLLEEINNNLNEGVYGINNLLEWCRCDYDMIQDQYRNLHNLTEEEMQKVIEKNCGNYKFMYDEIPYASELEYIWNICNGYLDYVNKQITKKELLDLID